MTKVSAEILLEEYLRAYLKPIYNFVYRYVNSADDAEDITQEVFVKTWRHFKRFDRSRSFKTWIFSIAKNTAIDFLRKRKVQVFSETEIETLADPAPLPQELLERVDLAQMLRSAMDKLSLKYRMVLFLRYNDHFTFREIAETLGEPLPTVKSRHRRALLLLRKMLQD